eukprot:7643094-Karenia_brevis.AAC.1
MEEALSHEQQKPDGLELYTYLDGHISSSSRSELLGLILSLFSPAPVHVALDSAAVLHPAQKILDFLRLHPNPDAFLQQLPQ